MTDDRLTSAKNEISFTCSESKLLLNNDLLVWQVCRYRQLKHKCSNTFSEYLHISYTFFTKYSQILFKTNISVCVLEYF